MNITNTVLTKTAEEITANATYTVEYVMINNVLTRIHTSVQISLPEGNEKENIGYITYENGSIFCHMQAGAKVSLFFLDFERFVEKIKESTGEMLQMENHSDR